MDFLPIRQDGERVYAGFWKRLWAALIDFIICVLVWYIPFRLQGANKIVGIFAWTSSIVFVCIYQVWFNAQFGGTLGKLAVGIRITKPNGRPIGWVEAWKRSSVDLFLASVFVSLKVAALLSVDSAEYSALDHLDRMDLLKKYFPDWLKIVDNTQSAWAWSELIVLLLNKRKRALHDFIARTVVIHNKFAERGAALARQEIAPASQ